MLVKCEMKRCNNIATGEWKLETARSTHYLKLCAACGFTAHSRRRFVVFRDKDDGKEITAHPLQYKAVSLVRTLK